MTIREELQAAIIGDEYVLDDELNVELKDGCVKLVFTCMYTFDVTYEGLDKVAALLGTDRMNLSKEHDYFGGCESCDYGSQTTVTIEAHGVASAAYEALNTADPS